MLGCSTGRSIGVNKTVTEGEAWEEIRFSLDPGTLESFLVTYPDGERSAEVRNRLARLAWQAVEASPDVAGYDRFLEEHPDSHFETLARTRRAMLAEQEGRDRKYQAYLARERAEWITARASGTLDAFDHFLGRFPKGPHAAEAAEARLKLAARLEHARERYRVTNYAPHILTVVVMVAFWLMSRLQL